MATQGIKYDEEMVGHSHPTKTDTLNRFLNLITAAGDILYGTAAATAARLAKGAAGALLGMNDADTAPIYKTLKVDDTGQMTNASQPAFLAYNSVTDANVTGNATNYGVVCDTEVFDQNADYNNGTGIFTAPVTGKYPLGCGVVFNGLLVAHAAHECFIVTSNRTYQIIDTFAAGANPFVGYRTLLMNALADMDAGDTAQVTVTITGAAQVVSVIGHATTVMTYFSGQLGC